MLITKITVLKIWITELLNQVAEYKVLIIALFI
jgi:hypothetical protein